MKLTADKVVKLRPWTEAVWLLGPERAGRLARSWYEHPTWATEPMPKGVPFELVPRKEQDR